MCFCLSCGGSGQIVRDLCRLLINHTTTANDGVWPLIGNTRPVAKGHVLAACWQRAAGNMQHERANEGDSDACRSLGFSLGSASFVLFCSLAFPPSDRAVAENDAACCPRHVACCSMLPESNAEPTGDHLAALVFSLVRSCSWLAAFGSSCACFEFRIAFRLASAASEEV